MPGLVMDDVSASGSRDWGNSYNRHGSNGESNAQHDNNIEKADKTSQSLNGFKGDDGMQSGTSVMQKNGNSVAILGRAQEQWAPELMHITQGFFPYAQLVNRAVQQCYNDLCDVITELAEAQGSSQAPFTNGKSQDAGAVQKRTRILDFTQAKRTEFIKLLVLSQWSRQAVDVSKLIDLQNFIRIRHAAYQTAVQRVADMKRDLVRAQVANPDLHTALEVLNTGRVADMPEVSIIICQFSPSPY
jgi:mediator of RNA polymerase II transcription subunit 14